MVVWPNECVESLADSAYKFLLTHELYMGTQDTLKFLLTNTKSQWIKDYSYSHNFACFQFKASCAHFYTRPL